MLICLAGNKLSERKIGCMLYNGAASNVASFEKIFFGDLLIVDSFVFGSLLWMLMLMLALDRSWYRVRVDLKISSFCDLSEQNLVSFCQSTRCGFFIRLLANLVFNNCRTCVNTCESENAQQTNKHFD